MKTSLKITSSFENNSYIPDKYSCQWLNINPKINLENIPNGTKSFAIIVDDPDAPTGTFVHWVAWNIPVGNINEASSWSWKYLEWINSAWTKLYFWPCPPVGHWIHHYHFQVFALDIILEIFWDVNKWKLMREIKNHIISEWEIIWLYEREEII